MLKRITFLLVGCVAVLFLSATPAMAALFGDGGAALDAVLDSITVAPSPIPGQTSVSVLTDEITEGRDKHWHITASGASVNTLIVELAGFAASNTFGVYDIANPANRVQIFGGAAGAGGMAFLGIDASRNVYINGVPMSTFGSTWFGYYLNSPQGVFYSDTALNVDQVDHMYAYQGTDTDWVQIAPWAAGLWTDSEYILAFEDLSGGGDRDYDDFVVMVESVIVPVPAAVVLGILGLGAVGVKLRKFS